MRSGDLGFQFVRCSAKRIILPILETKQQKGQAQVHVSVDGKSRSVLSLGARIVTDCLNLLFSGICFSLRRIRLRASCFLSCAQISSCSSANHRNHGFSPFVLINAVISFDSAMAENGHKFREVWCSLAMVNVVLAEQFVFFEKRTQNIFSAKRTTESLIHEVSLISYSP